jgi:hypothetical protein
VIETETMMVNKKRRSLAIVVSLSVLVLPIAVACSIPSSSATFTEMVPDRAAFPDVAQAMVHKCGTLDCHGSASRNMRIYGNEGVRWSPTDRTLVPLCTTSDEVDQDFDSVVGLEPEQMSEVVAENGANPDRLTMIRKARGIENHKGGAIMSPGDALDTCITSWLANATNTAACQTVDAPTVPPPPAGQPAVCQPGP